MDERFLQPAISPDEAVNVPAVEAAQYKDEQIGMTPAVSATERPHGYMGGAADHPSVMRVRMRQAAAARDLVRGSNVQWSTRSVNEPDASAHVPYIRQAAPSDRILPGGLVEREYTADMLKMNDMPAKAPMEHVLRGTVKRLVSQSGEYESPRMRYTRTRGVMDMISKTPMMASSAVGARTSDAIGTMIDRVAREAFGSAPIDMSDAFSDTLMGGPPPAPDSEANP